MENDLKQLLKNGIVEFSFVKKNGEIRNARGTRNIDLLMSIDDSGFTESDKPKGIGVESDTSCPYWDLDKKAWRSVCVDSIISINI